MAGGSGCPKLGVASDFGSGALVAGGSGCPKLGVASDLIFIVTRLKESIFYLSKTQEQYQSGKSYFERISNK